MMHSKKKGPLYPKSHLLAASGVAALLSLALLVFPSREVEAKRTSITLELDAAALIGPAASETLAPEPGTGDSPFSLSVLEEDTESGDLSVATEEHAGPQTTSLTVASGDTLSTLFARVGLPASAMHEVLASSKEAKELTRLKVGQVFDFELDASGSLTTLRTQPSKLVSLMIQRSAAGFAFSKEEIKPQVQTTYARGTIDSSLFVAAKRAGLSHNLTMDLANIFGYDIDFALDIRKGDSFELIYESKHVDGQKVGSGDILSARFTNRGKTYTAVRYVNKQGVASYYTANGESMRKAFIRTPVDFARISSRFSTGRKHPILNKIRAHKGVDYAAPHGTPIKSAGDGKVILAGRNGGYGNTVIIQHGSRYRTLYAHMQGFAKGIQNGAAVKQGQIIGYIGTTGLSTGPHLHYEFQVDGVHVDPLSQKLPMSDPIPSSELARFKQVSQPLLARMDKEKATQLALNGQ